MEATGVCGKKKTGSYQLFGSPRDCTLDWWYPRHSSLDGLFLSFCLFVQFTKAIIDHEEDESIPPSCRLFLLLRPFLILINTTGTKSPVLHSITTTAWRYGRCMSVHICVCLYIYISTTPQTNKAAPTTNNPPPCPRQPGRPAAYHGFPCSFLLRPHAAAAAGARQCSGKRGSPMHR